MSFKFYVLDRDSIQNIVNNNFQQAYDLIEETYLQFFNNEAFNPPSCFLRFPDKPESRIIALPSYMKAKHCVAGIKWISSFPENIKSGIQRASSVFILNSGETGYPLACLESAYISAFRTASSAVLAAECLIDNKKDIKLGIVGAGYIARTILEVFEKRNWGFRKINIYDQERQQSLRLEEELSSEFDILETADTLQEVITKSNLIVFTTTALEPYVNNLAWLSHNPIVLHVSLRDLSEDIISNSINYVDDIDHVLQENTSPHLAYKKYRSKEFIVGGFYELLSRKGEESRVKFDKPVIFSPMGMGILDLAVANFVFERAIENDSIKEIANFFGDVSR